MMTSFLLAALALLITPTFFAAPTAAATQQQSAMAAPTTIMAVGDSITFGCGYNAKPPGYGLECDGADSSYRSKLYGLLTAAGHPVRFVGRAKSGDASFPAAQHAHEGYSGRRIDQLDDILFGAHNPWAAAPPDVMLVMLGTNDIWHQNATVSTMKARMDSFLNHTFIRMPQTQVFLASITNMAGRVNDSKHDKISTSNCPGHDGNPKGHSCCWGCKHYWPPMVAGLNSMLAQQVRTHNALGKNITFVDMFTDSKVCSTTASPEANDCCHSYHVHPTKVGYESMAAVWFKHVGLYLRAAQRGRPVELKTDDRIDNPFAWIRAIESGPTGQKITLKASTIYEIDRQYQLPRGTELTGAGTDPASRTVIRAVGKHYSYNCGPHAANRKGLVLGDDTVVRGLHLVGMETRRQPCLW